MSLPNLYQASQVIGPEVNFSKLTSNVTGKLLSPESSEMIALITDPYHDFNLKNRGYPDGKALISTIKYYATRTTIACPFSLAAGETWSFHVFTTPYHYRSPLQYATYSGTLTKGVPEQIGPVNILHIKWSAAGAVAASSFSVLGASAVGSASQAVADQTRTVSLGFEIHNTTANIYKSGSLTVYRTPYQEALINLPCAPSPYSEFTGHIVGTIPHSLQAASQLPNTRTWEAEAGAYCVALPAPDNAFSTTLPSNTLLVGGLALNGVFLERWPGESTTSALTSWSPLACAGVISSQYSDTNQTFALDMRQVLEIQPNTGSSELQYATTAPSTDAAFLKIYKRMFNRIPPGVPVGFNSAGEWFRRILLIVKDVIPSVVSALPPNAQAIAQAALPIVNNLVDKAVSKLGHPAIQTNQKTLQSSIRKKNKANVTQRMLPSRKQ